MEFKVMDNGKTITGHVGSVPKDLVIPEGIVTICSNAFEGKYIETLELPSTLKCIEAEAFKNNKIAKVIIPEGVIVIGREAFYNNTITRVELPSTLVTHEYAAFCNNGLCGDSPDLPANFRNGVFRVDFYNWEIDDPRYLSNEVNTFLIKCGYVRKFARQLRQFNTRIIIETMDTFISHNLKGKPMENANLRLLGECYNEVIRIYGDEYIVAKSLYNAFIELLTETTSPTTIDTDVSTDPYK